MAEGAETSEDGLRWTIRLRPGLRFHDGEPVRGPDCVASLQRWGAREGVGQLLLAAVDTWEADDRSFTLRLRRPFPTLLSVLGKPDSSAPFIMPERLARTDPSRAITEMVGSGPFRFVAGDYVSGARVAYERFGAYVPRPTREARRGPWQRPRRRLGPPGPRSSTWTASSGTSSRTPPPPPPPSSAARWIGGRPRCPTSSPASPPTRPSPRPPPTPRAASASSRLNHLHPPFDDREARRAVLQATDQEALMRAAVGDDPSLWETCRSLFPRRTPYFEDLPQYMPASLEAARRTLAASRYRNERVVVLDASDSPVLSALSQVTADTLRRVGFNVDLQSGDYGTFVQRRASREPVERGGWSVFTTTGAAIGPGHPRRQPPHARPGAPGLVSAGGPVPRPSGLTQAWLDAPDEPGRTAIAARLNRLGLDEVASIPLGQVYARTAHRRRFTGIAPGIAPYFWGVRTA